ncbi:MAG: T9SS type A sorting domain-containing protein, partial [Ignavibacterium sp.]|nr:T9SS type A sorting domain-containing protein [Ignavibacterium sp.]
FYVGAHGYKLHSGQYVVSDFFDGQIDELRIWNYQKNSQQIIALKDAPLDAAYYNTIDSGLVGYWRFDLLEDLGINNDGPDDVRDLSVLHNHLDLAGDAHLVQPNPVIPVELISFLAEPINGNVKLKWSTATELNNYGFEVERCLENRDWRIIGFLEGKGTTSEIQNYSYYDNLFGVNSEKIFYRLKQIDFNGQFNYSSELEIEIDFQPDEFNLYQNYPNPFNPGTVIKYSIPKLNLVSLIIYNSLGQQVRILVDEIKIPGYYQVEFDATDLPSGVYFYSLLSGEYSATKKMILLK